MYAKNIAQTQREHHMRMSVINIAARDQEAMTANTRGHAWTLFSGMSKALQNEADGLGVKQLHVYICLTIFPKNKLISIKHVHTFAKKTIFTFHMFVR